MTYLYSLWHQICVVFENWYFMFGLVPWVCSLNSRVRYSLLQKSWFGQLVVFLWTWKGGALYIWYHLKTRRNHSRNVWWWEFCKSSISGTVKNHFLLEFENMTAVINLLALNTRSIFHRKKSMQPPCHPSFQSIPLNWEITRQMKRNFFEGRNLSYSCFWIVVSVLKHTVQ